MIKFGFDYGDECKLEKGGVVDSWMTGDDECNAESKEYEWGGVYHKNFMDVIGCRDHDCFWDCSNCKKMILYEEIRPLTIAWIKVL